MRKVSLVLILLAFVFVIGCGDTVFTVEDFSGIQELDNVEYVFIHSSSVSGWVVKIDVEGGVSFGGSSTSMTDAWSEAVVKAVRFQKCVKEAK